MNRANGKPVQSGKQTALERADAVLLQAKRAVTQAVLAALRNEDGAAARTRYALDFIERARIELRGLLPPGYWREVQDDRNRTAGGGTVGLSAGLPLAVPPPDVALHISLNEEDGK